jgi:pimeloyl-ACP methyl ester carboxylesterase
VAVDWQLCESGPIDAQRTVLLLPGGMCSAGSYAELMAQPALAQTRLIAATLPGQAGAPSPDDYSLESYARHVTDLATQVGGDAVVGFSMGAVVAVEMLGHAPAAARRSRARVGYARERRLRRGGALAR